MLLGELADIIGIDSGILKLALQVFKSALHLFEFPKHVWIPGLKWPSVSLLGGLGGLGVLILETLKTTFGIHHFVGAGIERVASRADIHSQVLYGACDLDHVTAVAGSGRVGKFRVNAFFHKNLVYYKSLVCSKEQLIKCPWAKT